MEPRTAVGVAIGTNLVIQFSRAVTAGSGNVVMRKTSDNSVVETIAAAGGRVSGSGRYAAHDR